MTHLQAVGKVPDPTSVAILVRYYDNLVPSVQQTAGELVDVALHPSHVGVEKVTHHAATTYGIQKIINIYINYIIIHVVLSLSVLTCWLSFN